MSPAETAGVTLSGDSGLSLLETAGGSPAIGFPRIRFEQAPAEARPPDLRDPGLGGRGHQEVGERLAAGDVDAWGVLRVEVEHVVHVVEQRVALDQQGELHLIAPGEVGGAVAQGVGVLLVAQLQRLPHPLTRLAAPPPPIPPPARPSPPPPLLTVTPSPRRLT